jgi:hypothetical protein
MICLHVIVRFCFFSKQTYLKQLLRHRGRWCHRRPERGVKMSWYIHASAEYECVVLYPYIAWIRHFQVVFYDRVLNPNLSTNFYLPRLHQARIAFVWQNIGEEIYSISASIKYWLHTKPILIVACKLTVFWIWPSTTTMSSWITKRNKRTNIGCILNEERYLPSRSSTKMVLPQPQAQFYHLSHSSDWIILHHANTLNPYVFHRE